MINYLSLEEMLNSTEGMTKLINNSGQDDNTLSYPGVDWFRFNGVAASTIYVSGNTWFGLGSNSEQLLVCRRDAKLWNLYKQEAMLFGIYRVLKFRWEGYTQYNSTSSDRYLAYEWYFFETGDMFLNIVTAPTNSSYLGTSKINGGTNKTFNVTTAPNQYISFYHTDDTGTMFDIQYGLLEIAPPFERRYLLSDKEGKYYRVRHERAMIDGVIFKGYQIIRTGIIPNQDTKVVAKIKTSIFNDAALFGVRLSTSEGKYGVFLSSSTQLHGQYNTESTTVSVEDYLGIDVVIELSKDGLKRDGVVIAEYAEASFTCPGEMVIGSYNTNGVIDNRYFKGTIYEFDVWQGEEKVLELRPCIDEQNAVCFIDMLTETYYYREGFGNFEALDPLDVRDDTTFLEELEVTELISSVFLDFGNEEIPTNKVLARLVNPALLYWQDSDIDVKATKIRVQAMPPTQVVYSKNNAMIDSTIKGIESVECVADTTSLFAFSFDEGQTWKAYINNEWVNLSEETSGMTAETVNAIGTDAWAIATETMQYKVRFTIFEGGYVEKIIIHYLN